MERAMSSWEMKILTAEAHRLIALAARDADLRAELRALAQEILGATEAPEPHPDKRGSPAVGPDPAQSATEAMPPEIVEVAVACDLAPPEVTHTHPVPEPEPLKELTLGRRTSAPIRTVPPPGRPNRLETDEDDLGRIADRCRAKAEAARWVTERQRRIRERADFPVEDAPTSREMVEWADSVMNCYYWPNDPDGSQAADLSLVDAVGGCFETVAAAISLMADSEGRRRGVERALPLLTEAQSMLRRALQRLNAPDDPDQLAVYEWVRETAGRHRIYIKRHLRADDLADPAGWPDLLTRIEALAACDQQSRQHGAWINRLRDHLKLLREGIGTGRDWQAVIEAVEEMVGEGVPPNSRELRELLLPVIDDLPDRDDLSPGFRLVLREIDHFLATRPPSPKATGVHGRASEVEEAARLLGGRSVVLIGGARRPDAQESLRNALRLKELIWLETKEHQAIEAFEPIIARPGVALVLLAIRWASHSFGEVRIFCDRYGKPLVRLPAGYNPNQVAAQILAQCSGQLGGG
jgi:hypothetical protein